MTMHVRKPSIRIVFTSAAALLVALAGNTWGQDAAAKRDAAKDKEREKIEAARNQAQEARDATRDARGTVREDKAGTRGTVIQDRGTGRATTIEDRASGRATTIEDRAKARDTARDDRVDIRDARRDRRLARREFRADAIRSGDLGLWLRRGVRGLLVSDVAGTGVISQSGLKEGDEIISVDGEQIKSEQEFLAQLFKDRANNKNADIVVLRNGQQQSIALQPKQFIAEHMAKEPDHLADLGLILDTSSADHLKVQSVVPRSPAFYAGVRSGDRITSFQGQRIAAMTDLVKSLASAVGTKNLEVNRNNQTRQLEIDIPDETAEEHTRTVLRPNLDNPNPTPAPTVPAPADAPPKLNNQ